MAPLVTLLYGSLWSALATVDWIFAGITPPDALHRIGKAEGKGASEQFKERG